MTAIRATWDGEAMRVDPRFAKLADRQWAIGGSYMIDEVHPASTASRSHYFASIKAAFDSLSADDTARFPTTDHLRKWALIKAGFRDERSIPCASHAEALRLASFIKPMDDYAVVVVSEAVVSVYTAKSQSQKAMGNFDFQQSKQAVLSVLAERIGVTPEKLAIAGKEQS